ncbi:MAG: hypothetical protein IJ759_04435 [Bacteroidales bacterium]|nr:hypothetical protein [Bacteroidales bacterium]
MKRLLLFIFLFSSFIVFSQQDNSAKSEFDFVMYLIGNSMKEEAVVLMQNNSEDNDSINFLRGFTYYSSKMLDLAADNFSKVSQSSELFTESRFFSSLSNAHLFHLDKAESDLNMISSQDGEINNLKNFSLAGINLLKRNYNLFDTYINSVDSNNYPLNVETARLLQLKTELLSYKKKSLFVAGALSTLVPGLGKVYAGNIGEGISSFLICGSLMGVTAENWYKKGLTNWKTILFGTISAVFYIGNIYGSVVTVKVNCENFNSRTDVQILYNIHIPLRSSFRR